MLIVVRDALGASKGRPGASGQGPPEGNCDRDKNLDNLRTTSKDSIEAQMASPTEKAGYTSSLVVGRKRG